MAESMEEMDRSTDVDREIDKGEFRKAQFATFKHDFLESFDESGYAKLEHLTLDKNLKKEVVNMARRLQKARISLNSLPDTEAIAPVIAKIDETFGQLIALSKESSEFSARNIKLPEYSRTDVEALLGKMGPEKSNQMKEKEMGGENQSNKLTGDRREQKEGPVEWLCRSNEEYEKRIEALLGAGELMLNEWHEIKQYLQRNTAMSETPK
ncbi:hypothetical protein niasHS_014556 [Heterodera schachtii]|uniref:Uncharacterized protein n=1 Tax=Heterodera schachtii TaxID=97005 RepID=A0ABD2IF75_HETSC